tara:strand:- start:5249 stop:6325 length:1077 start_codon:yes stop_codon:yes gene_type:complete
MATPVSFPKQNNFDLIRLLAATQVVIIHGVEHLGFRLPFHEITLKVMEAFPGVPIFFLVSGFLITSSYQRSPALRDFFKNRVLRIFPALWLCFGFSLLLVFFSGYAIGNDIAPQEFLFWAFTQLSFLQFYNPEFLRGFGVGAMNGSLWTIPVEMQFYILTPIMMFIFTRKSKIFFVILAISVALNFTHTRVIPDIEGLPQYVKILGVSFLPWIYMFMLGALCNIYWDKISPFLVGKFKIWMLSYGVIILISHFVDIGARNNVILLPWVLVIGGLVLSATFTKPALADSLLNRNDISYGVYIYHMPVFNYFIERQLFAESNWAWLAIIFVFIVSYLSWRLVERPALSLKNTSLLGRSAV